MKPEVKYINTGWVPNPKGNILWDAKPVDMIWDNINKKWIIKKEDKDDSK